MRVVINGQEYTGGFQFKPIKPDFVGEAKLLNGNFHFKMDTQLSGEYIDVISPRHACIFAYTYVETTSGG